MHRWATGNRVRCCSEAVLF
ncbi:hypothetical protein CIB84_007707 [Bambusicola thoracicus]|uniref:Uncharacterized protein n=1 Tax=Bambusicola thoracicus TaxID=9083 RepID=A0A2P4SWN8_BAMTH|nr:hypothetical protein CIB84_007707 [Bambusicola thoracicus]